MGFGKKSVNDRLLAFLKAGNDITANQARSRFGIENVSARISQLRQQGYAIYLNTKTTSNGETIRVYRLGTPTRLQVAAGYVGLKDWYIREQLSFTN